MKTKKVRTRSSTVHMCIKICIIGKMSEDVYVCVCVCMYMHECLQACLHACFSVCTDGTAFIHSFPEVLQQKKKGIDKMDKSLFSTLI